MKTNNYSRFNLILLVMQVLFLTFMAVMAARLLETSWVLPFVTVLGGGLLVGLPVVYLCNRAHKKITPQDGFHSQYQTHN